nr:MAG TPA: hypothetical protein [Caudoviricetes sp.]
MYFGKKNITKNLAVSEEVANIALPKSRCHTENTYFCRNTANFLSGVISFDDGTLASFREGFASFVTYITKLSDQCQSPLKVSARRTVRPLRLVPTVRNHSNSLPKSNLSSYWRVTLPNLSHLRAFTAVPYRLLASGATTSSKAAMPQCTNSLLNSKPSNLSIVSDNRPFIPVPV